MRGNFRAYDEPVVAIDMEAGRADVDEDADFRPSVGACIHGLPKDVCSRCRRCPHGRLPSGWPACGRIARRGPMDEGEGIGALRREGSGGTCAICGKRFAFESGFEWHIANRHQGPS